MATNAQQCEWLEGLEKRWRRELKSGRQSIEEIWNSPLVERVSSGHALGALDVVEVSRYQIVVRPPFENDSGECRLREGDFVCLSRDTPWSPEGRFIHLGEDERGIHLYHLRGILPAAGSRNWVMDRDHVDLTERYAAAMEALAGSELGRDRILPLLMGHAGCEVDGEIFETISDEFEHETAASKWHDSQKDAIVACSATQDAWLVQGPPGTGKTYVLAEVVRRLVERGERVLVSGPTHRAINHALKGCRGSLPAAVRVAKIGPAMLGPAEIEHFENYAASGLMDSGEPHVIGATPFALWSVRSGLRDAKFDTVVIDESSQVTVMVGAMAMLRGERWLFFGDDCQLPPVVLVDDGVAARERSIFSLLKNRGFDTMLEETWRLNHELAEWPSATFYRNRLACRHDRRLMLSPGSVHPALVAPGAVSLILCEEKRSTVRSEDEAQATVEVVRELLKGGLAADEIGVVTPFRAQASRIRQLLRDPAQVSRQVVVDTVERFQGQEREAIVISLAASNSAWVRRMADFLFQRERWNVAVTRARRKVVVIASKGLLETAETMADEGHEGAICFSSWLKSVPPEAVCRFPEMTL